MSSQLTESIIARQSAEAQEIIRVLLSEIAGLRAELDELRRQGKGKTSQNSSLPPNLDAAFALAISPPSIVLMNLFYSRTELLPPGLYVT